MTAAHRTLPMGSLVVVTNLKTGQSSVMRITDRGPFVEGRMLDLTMAAAKATGIYRAGHGTGPHGCVPDAEADRHRRALVRADWRVPQRTRRHQAESRSLLRKYTDANVIEFPGEKSYWVRIRPEGDNRQMAEYIAQHLRPTEGEAYLTRLD